MYRNAFSEDPPIYENVPHRIKDFTSDYTIQVECFMQVARGFTSNEKSLEKLEEAFCEKHLGRPEQSLLIMNSFSFTKEWSLKCDQGHCTGHDSLLSHLSNQCSDLGLTWCLGLVQVDQHYSVSDPALRSGNLVQNWWEKGKKTPVVDSGKENLNKA